MTETQVRMHNQREASKAQALNECQKWLDVIAHADWPEDQWGKVWNKLTHEATNLKYLATNTLNTK